MRNVTKPKLIVMLQKLTHKDYSSMSKKDYSSISNKIQEKRKWKMRVSKG